MLSPTTVGRIAVVATPATLPDLPDDLLEDIFLCLDAADLARASTSCTAFRGIISGHRFLRRYQSLHPPPVLGFLDCTSVVPDPGDTNTPGLDDDDDAAGRDHRICAFYQAEASPAARQLARATDLTFAFLTDLRSWTVSDFRDGRVLLSRYAGGVNNCTSSIFEDLVIYDPLHRRHVQLPAIPRPEAERHGGGVTDVEAFLVPVTDEEKERDEDLPFRVICNVYTEEEIWAYIFSSATGTWRAPTTAFTIGDEYNWFIGYAMRRHYACGCFFWTRTVSGPTIMLALEMTTSGDDDDMKFSIVELPDELFDRLHFAVVEAAAKGSRLGLLALGDGTLEFYSKSMQDGVGTGEWQRDMTTSNPLPSGYLVLYISAGGAAEGYILMRAMLLDQLCLLANESDDKKPDAHYFALEVRTLLLQRLCVLKFKTRYDFPYASFPPPLSLPSI